MSKSQRPIRWVPDLVCDALRRRTRATAGEHTGKVESVEWAAPSSGHERGYVGHGHADERAAQLTGSERPKYGPYRVRPLVFVAVDASQDQQGRAGRSAARNEGRPGAAYGRRGAALRPGRASLSRRAARPRAGTHRASLLTSGTSVDAIVAGGRIPACGDLCRVVIPAFAGIQKSPPPRLAGVESRIP